MKQKQLKTNIYTIARREKHSFSRREFLGTTSRALLGAWGTLQLAGLDRANGDGSPKPRPNILFILTDDQGWRDASCYGSSFYETTNLDRLARQGMLFTDAYAAAPLCSPTRASVMTGRSPARLHLTHIIQYTNPPNRKLLGPTIRTELPLEEITLAEMLKHAGYATASIGKWHLGGTGFEPQDQGFHLNIAGTKLGQPPDYFYPYRRTIGNGQTFELSHMPEGKDGDYLTDRLTDEAEDFIERNKDKPFFLYMSYFSPHTSIGARLQAKADKIAKYEAKAKAHPSEPKPNPIYAAMLETLDENIGRLMQKLDDLKLTDQTVVVFVSDNGGMKDSTSNAPLRDAKASLYEGGIRVPMIIRWPGVVKPGSVSHTPVTTDDFFATLQEMAGENRNFGQVLDGVSLVPLLNEGGGLQRDALYWHFPHYTGATTPCSAVREGDFKLIEFYEDGRLELYNLKDDLSETTNLAGKMPDKAKALQAKLAAWLKSVDADMPVPNPSAK